jgi:hypothetical protein
MIIGYRQRVQCVYIIKEMPIQGKDPPTQREEIAMKEHNVGLS